MPRIHDITGARFGSLVALRAVGVRQKRGALWLCLCDCGNEHVVEKSRLSSGVTQSCGCRKSAALAVRHTPRHGMAARGNVSPEYRAWSLAKRRCFNPRDISFPRYGGRGITMCAEWVDNFEAFYAYIGPKPTLTHTIDRIDPNGHYEPGNVRWATPTEQTINRRNVTLFRDLLDGPMTLQQVARGLAMYPQELKRFFTTSGVLPVRGR